MSALNKQIVWRTFGAKGCAKNAVAPKGKNVWRKRALKQRTVCRTNVAFPSRGYAGATHTAISFGAILAHTTHPTGDR